jgi:hypothetical protein
MVSYVFIFWTALVIMAVIGAVRGWAKELLVTFSAITAIFILQVLETYLAEYLAMGGLVNEFWPRTGLFVLLTFFGYQTPGTFERFRAAARREKAQDTILGGLLGLLNGYLIVGSLWHFLDTAGYPFRIMLSPAQAMSFNGIGELGQQAAAMGAEAAMYLAYMPPVWLGGATIYFAMAVAFTFVLIVFI